MDRPTLKAEERNLFGKKVKNLRKDGIIPGHVFGKGLETESVQVKLNDLAKVYDEVGETGLINLKIGEERVRPVLIREIQSNPLNGQPLNIDFYQVNLKTKVKVYVPIELIGEEPELVHTGEAVVLNPISEIEIEALPTDLIDKIEVNIEVLKNIDDAITVEQLNYDRSKVEIFSNPDEVVVKLAPAVTEEMQELMEEAEAETQAAQEAAAEAAGEEATSEEGEEGEKQAGEGTEEITGEGGAEAVKEESSEENSQ